MIDHLIVGPAGVFAVSTHRHPRGRAWVGRHGIGVNAQPTAYVRTARTETQLVAERLEAAAEAPVAVQTAIVFVDLGRLDLQDMPSDVHVTERGDFVKWLRAQPKQLDSASVDRIFNLARRRSTWA